VVQHAPQAAVVVNGQTPSRSPNPHSNNNNQQQSVPLALVSPNLSDMRAFLCSPLPRNNGVLQCYIRRNKSGTNKLFPIYSLYLKVLLLLSYHFMSCRVSCIHLLLVCSLAPTLSLFPMCIHRRAMCS